MEKKKPNPQNYQTNKLMCRTKAGQPGDYLCTRAQRNKLNPTETKPWKQDNPSADHKTRDNTPISLQADLLLLCQREDRRERQSLVL